MEVDPDRAATRVEQGLPVAEDLHFDVALAGKFVDAGALMRAWGYVSLEDAWGTLGRVSWPHWPK